MRRPRPASNPLAVLAALASQSKDGLTLRHLQIIMVLCQDDLHSPSAIARHLGVAPGAVTRACKRLRDRGLIDRHSATDNLRFVILTPTDSGRALYARISAALAEAARGAAAAAA